MAIQIIGSGWCCTPCLFYIEYDNVPADYSAEEVTDWLAHIENIRRTVGSEQITLGHVCSVDDECSHVGERCPDDADCDCGRVTFSRSRCDHCGDTDAGERHAFTWWLTVAELASA